MLTTAQIEKEKQNQQPTLNYKLPILRQFFFYLDTKITIKYVSKTFGKQSKWSHMPFTKYLHTITIKTQLERRRIMIEHFAIALVR